ncbi:polysaccharide deacetylase family protein [Salinimicrobium sp. MT39]|uniref:Polysaccharide deacetylase family protein n=1 Tax=Salinimicrobium profundisediminis TaxID=2994553 RepID=A0A9X3CWN6_9FLAO|nr:polysaccharide deacetylase family protein [Salinimicrobium profundisediminis]MCX2837903.1 polysaccharide deacetylase family protein [Salinimicrobium profundisediminis]
MIGNGALVISLDFELLWGVFDKVDWREKKEYFLKTRQVIPQILQLFQKNEISCTWATVGMLFNESWEEWNQNIPDVLPEYENKKLSAYSYGKSIQSKETEELCFAPDLIKRIKETPGQEIGTHTYSHYYCLEPGQGIDGFNADLTMACWIAQKFGIELKSLVFPRNQYNKEYLEICRQIGLGAVRTNPENWYWKDTQKDSLLQKVFRTGDAYFGLNDKSYSDLPEIFPGIQGQKASRLLRPYSRKRFQNKKRLQRIISEMEAAAKHNQIYHLWWHPHNFGGDPKNNMKELIHILDNYKKLKVKYDFSSVTMETLSSLHNNGSNG